MSAPASCGHNAANAYRRLVPILLQKSFALVIKIYFGCTRDFRVKMWGTSSPDDKRTDDLGNTVEGTRFLTAEKLAPGDLGLLQRYLPILLQKSARGPLRATFESTHVVD